MNTPFTRLALALSLAFAGPAAWAQATATDGSSNTIAVTAGGAGSLTTNGSGSLTVSQRSQGSATSGGGQTVAVGSAVDAAITRGDVSARGVANGSVSQGRETSSSLRSAQTLTVGSVGGTLDAAQITADGSLQGQLVQTSRRGGLDASSVGQRVDVGSVSDASGGTLAAQGRVLGDTTSITQDHTGQQQLLRVGSINDVALLNANASGQLSGQVQQIGSGTRSAEAVQSIDVGSIVGSQASTVTTVGVLDGNVTQNMVVGVGREQRIAVGSVRNVDGGGRITTGGTVQGDLRQTGSADATVRVGAVEGGAAGTVTTQGSLSGGAIIQSSSFTGQQGVDIGSALGVSGQVATQGDVTGRITQNMNAGSALAATQTVSVGSVERTRGNVGTRALLSGNVTQTTQVGGSSTQQVLVGAVLTTGTLSVHTDATVSGNITQTADGVGERQRVLFGGAVGR